MAQFDYVWGKSLMVNNIMEILSNMLQTNSEQRDAIITTLLSVMISIDDFEDGNTDMLKKISILVNNGDLNDSIFDKLIKSMINLNTGVVDEDNAFNLIKLALNSTDELQRAAGAFILHRRMNSHGGWIRAGLFSKSASKIDTIFTREVDDDVREKQFVWSWDEDIIKTLLEIVERKQFGARYSARCLVQLVKLEGIDREDVLEIQASWESTEQNVPINICLSGIF